ncbi:hypothetical protein, conserved [Trypanosoma cruzi]|uniref:Uncharacterized protein n=1 Tax=Trypanosoma cruzi (strain CL Brener) TaxID=353153 RepID=Q4DAS2_TRYCC|nr:hypothetical protein, conserved [Trypanosoma cruzi]EAN89622.1 hypothetical protein, conserved [Trypanosoma cruzi]|eukprot:XP_811473.1 hypothetical protein [Trypanosoma cruzi strain CL Brener]
MKAAGSTAVKFDPNPLKDGVSSIYTPGDGAADVLASSRISRQINFVDDGKLFEGHFTLHTRGLKSLIQLLVDQQSEQQVIINDLQDQMNTIRQQTSKVRRAVNAAPMFVAPEGGTDTGSVLKEVEDLRRRVKRLEGFRALWGVHHEEVEALISTYGDPVVTPEEYTAYLLNLQPFRQLRSDAQHSAVSLVERRLSISAQQRSRESGSRKRISRDDDLLSPVERDARDNSRAVRDRRNREDEPRSPAERDARDNSRAARDRRNREDEPRGPAERDARDNSRAARDRRNREDEPRSPVERDARDNSRAARDRRNREDEPRSPVERDARDNSRAARDRRNREDEPRSPVERDARDNSRAARDRRSREDEPRSPVERDARDNSRAARDRRNREDEPRSPVERDARDNSRAARDRRNREDEPRSPVERDARDNSRAARDRRNREDEPRSPVERDAREKSRAVRDRRSHEDAPSGFDDEGESLRQLESRVAALEQRLRRGVAAVHSSSRKASANSGHSSVSPIEVVDEQAREDLEELERFVVRRFKELDKALSKSRDATPAAATSPVRGAGHPVGRSERLSHGLSVTPTESGGSNAKRSNEAAVANKDNTNASESKQRKERNAPTDAAVVDQVAREDAFAALDQVANLEKFVNRKLKELSVAIGKELGPGSVRPSGESRQAVSLEPQPQGAMVDQIARDDAARSIEAVQELEEDWGKRWQSLEERLRIIGRASVSKGSLQASAAASSIDRKAREDASMSLMRIQQLEREISGFRRLLQRQETPITSEEVAPPDARGDSGVVFPVPPKVQRPATFPLTGKGPDGAVGSTDVEYQKRMQDLEQEVEQRMKEVNRALATLRSTQSGFPVGNSPGATDAFGGKEPQISNQVVFNSRDTDSLELLEPSVSFSRFPASQTAVLVMKSREAAGVGSPIRIVEPMREDAIVLRSPQLEGFGTPLVKREMPGAETPSQGMVRNEEEQLRQMRATNGGGTESWQGVYSSGPHLAPHGDGNLPVTDAAGGAAVSTAANANLNSVPMTLANADLRSHPSNSRLPVGAVGRASPMDRTGELDQLRSHSTVLHKVSVSPRGKMGERFLVEQNALGHITPCVVYNCAWCAAQKQGISAQTARSAQ